MNEPFAVMGTPGVGFFAMLIIGAIAGWLAERFTASNHGLLTNIFVGIGGSFVGTRLAQVLGIYPGGWLMHILVATVGAALLILVWRALTSRQA